MCNKDEIGEIGKIRGGKPSGGCAYATKKALACRAFFSTKVVGR